MSEVRTAIEIGDARRERAIAAYHREHRFRHIVQMIAHQAVERSGVHERNEVTWEPRDLSRFAIEIAAEVLQAVYEEDAELHAQKSIADQYRKIAEDALALSPARPMFLQPLAATAAPPAGA